MGASLVMLAPGAAFVLITLAIRYLEKGDGKVDEIVSHGTSPEADYAEDSTIRRTGASNHGDADSGSGAVDGRLRAFISIFMLCGMLLLASGLYVWNGTNKFVSRAVRVDGVLVSMRHSIRRIRSYPVVRYRGTKGHRHMLYSNVSSLFSNNYVGKRVKVLVDPSAPDEQGTAAIDDFFNLWGLATILIVSGSGFLLVSLAAKYITRDDDAVGVRRAEDCAKRRDG